MGVCHWHWKRTAKYLSCSCCFPFLFQLFHHLFLFLVQLFFSHFLSTEFKRLYSLILVSSTSNQQWLQLLCFTATEGREKVIHFPFHQEKVKVRQSRKFSVIFSRTLIWSYTLRIVVSNPSFGYADLSHRWSCPPSLPGILCADLDEPLQFKWYFFSFMLGSFLAILAFFRYSLLSAELKRVE